MPYTRCNIVELMAVSKHSKRLDEEYAAVYSSFDSPLIRKVRSEAFGEDIGQHSWITASELREYLCWLRLSSNDNVLDYGCGPAGPLTYIAQHSDARATGIDVNSTALQSARKRVAELALDTRVRLQQVDANRALPFSDATFSIALSIDVVMHLIDRNEAFQEVSRVLTPHGRFLFTDAGIINGPVSSEQIRIRSHYGMSQYVPDGFNDTVLSAAGFEITHKEVRNQGPVSICTGRLKARQKYKQELVCMLGADAYEHEQRYLSTMVELYERQTLLRYVYLARKTSL